MLFYYSSTGNSLYIAKQLGDEKMISIPQALKEENLVFEDEVIGIVCPDYSATLPNSVQIFLDRATLKADYLYMIITYGRLDSIVATWANEYASKNGIHMNYINTVLMVDNWLPSFDMIEEMKIDKHIPEQLEVIKNDLKERKDYISPYTQIGLDAYNRVSKRNIEEPKWHDGSALRCNTDKCIGCGICTRVCPVGRNKIVDCKRVSIKDTCDFCLGCIHACPQNAFYLDLPEKNPEARYRNPNINLREIMNSNHQY